MTRKERDARNAAFEIAVNADTDVDPGDLDNWSADDIYEWIEAWGCEWVDGVGWIVDDVARP